MTLKARLDRLEKVLSMIAPATPAYGDCSVWGTDEGQTLLLQALLHDCTLLGLDTRESIKRFVTGIVWQSPPTDEQVDALVNTLLELASLPESEQRDFLGQARHVPEAEQSVGEIHWVTIGRGKPKDRRRRKHLEGQE